MAAWTYWALGGFALILSGTCISGKSSPKVSSTWVFLGACLLAFSMTGLRAVHFQSQSLAPELEGKDISVTGIVASMPQSNDSGQKFRFMVEDAQIGNLQVSLPKNLYLSWYRGNWGKQGTANEFQKFPHELRAGERWQFNVRLKAPHGGLNPHGFDFELWLWDQGLQATGYVRAGKKDPTPTVVEKTAWYPVEQARQIVRERIHEQVTRSGPLASSDQGARFAGILAALVVGDQQGIDRADWDVFRATGVAHLMSISGLHITMFAWAAMMGVGGLWRRSAHLCLWMPAPRAALIAGVALAAAYAVFSGWGLPSQRTVWMLITVAALRLCAKEWPWIMIWLLACAVVVAIDPWALMQAGFWLSFVAVGILFASTVNRSNPRRDTLWVRFVNLLREQWVITLALTPLTLLLFGQVSLIGLLANCLAIPWVTLVITPLAMFGLFAPYLWDVAAQAIALLSWALGEFSTLPWATLSRPQSNLWLAVAGVMGGLLLVMRVPWSLRFSGFPLLLPVLLWQAPRPTHGHFELLAPDIGQGNSVLIQTAKHAFLYDAGPRFSSETDAGHRIVVPLLRSMGLQLDTLVLSHRDSDHSGGALSVLAFHPKAELRSSVENSHELQSVRPVQRCSAGQSWIWDGVTFDVIHPRESDYSLDLPSNALSCVLRIGNGSQHVLLTGDIEKPQELGLVASGVDLKADVLLMPHHGSKTSSSEAFLEAVSPAMAIVQAGYRNRYGHPAGLVMDRYAERGIRTFSSPSCGAFLWRSEQASKWSCHRDRAMRYWHHRLP